MVREFRRFLVAVLAAIGLIGLIGPAAASEFAPGSICRIYLGSGESAQLAESQPERWHCNNGGWRVESSEALVRFDLRGVPEDQRPQYMITRAAQFDRLVISALTPDGERRSQVWTPQNSRIADGFARMAVPLPETRAPPKIVIAQFEKPNFAGTISEAELVARQPFGWAGPLDIAVMLICGLVIAPIIFDLAYYRVMRQRFLLWHAATGTLMLSHIAISGGLLNRLVPLNLEQFQFGMTWTFSLAIATGAMFYREFVEPEAFGPRHRHLLLAAAVVSLVLAVFQTAHPFPATVMQQLYYAGWAPVALTIAWVLVVSIRRGSRAAVFQATAWMPLLITGIIRIFGNLGFSDYPLDLFFAFTLSIGFEVVVTAIGVADRFLALKRERDRAHIEVRILGQLADRDPLTGLLNRRALETRFADLLESGYSTMALVDIDHFKRINDSRGHAVGDKVLQTVAEVMTLDSNALAVRLGGEEFMLLLRGKDAVTRAEHIRSTLPTRIAAAVPGLEGLVTASMGLVELPSHGRVRDDFTVLYAQCDRLLYEAKNTGRNRMLRERMQSFGVGSAPARAAA